MKELITKILRKPLDIMGFNFRNEPTLTTILISYAILIAIFVVMALLLFSYIPSPYIYQIYLRNILALIFGAISIVGLGYSLKNIKSTSNGGYLVALCLIVGVVCCIVVSSFIYDSFGFKREIIETKLTTHYGAKTRNVVCNGSVRAEIDNKLYGFGCLDSNVEQILPHNLNTDSTYRLVILPHSHDIISAEKIETKQHVLKLPSGLSAKMELSSCETSALQTCFGSGMEFVASSTKLDVYSLVSTESATRYGVVIDPTIDSPAAYVVVISTESGTGTFSDRDFVFLDTIVRNIDKLGLIK
ncbi:MAG: hypothetical protein RL094_454 [Candidatus Parcubacteria bacterium]|jgi:hypothetical protein